MKKIKRFLTISGSAIGATVLTIPAAFADSTALQTAATSELTGGKDVVYAIGGIVVAICAAVAIIKLIKRAL